MYISIDIGGSKTRIAFSNNLKSLDATEKYDSEKDLSRQISKISEIVKKNTLGGIISGVSIGIPGTMDQKAKKFLSVPNYKILDGIDFGTFAEIFGTEATVLFSNDAKLACLGEATTGAGKQYRSVSYLTLSTGVGGCLIKDGKINADDVFEPGHHIINLDDEFIDNSGIRGSLEAYLSGTGFYKRFGILPEDCADQKIWDIYGEILGAGILNLACFWNPDVVVLGGSISINKFESFYTSLQNYLDNHPKIHLPKVKKTELEDDAGLIGGFVHLEKHV